MAIVTYLSAALCIAEKAIRPAESKTIRINRAMTGRLFGNIILLFMICPVAESYWHETDI